MSPKRVANHGADSGRSLPVCSASRTNCSTTYAGIATPSPRTTMLLMPTTRTFNVVFVGANHGSGIGVTGTPDQVVHYDGTQAVATAP